VGLVESSKEMSAATPFVFIIVSSLATFALYPLFISFLYRFQFRDPVNPDLPRTHMAKSGTPTAGGALPILVFIVLSLVFNRSREVVLLCGVVGSLGVLGVLEDFFKMYYRSRLRKTVRERIVPIVTLSGLSWNLYKLALFPWGVFKETFRALGSQTAGGIKTYQKILIQLLIAAGFAVWLVVNGGSRIWAPRLGSVDLGILFAPFAISMFLFFTNAIDITSGLDGLVGGLLLLSFSALLAISLALGRYDLSSAVGILIGGLLAFMYFNIYPARIFPGNVAELGWAGAFVVILFLLDRAFLMPVLGGVFLIEGLSDIIQVGSVKLGKGRVFLMAPIHHHFEMKGWPEAKVTMRFWLAGAFFTFLGLCLAFL